MRQGLFCFGLGVVGCAAGCTALVNPDESRLGTTRVVTDAGGQTDVAPLGDVGRRDASALADAEMFADVPVDSDVTVENPDASLADHSPDVPNLCAATRCDDGIACTVDSCDPLTGRCVVTSDDSACGSFCTTGARCDLVRGCVGAVARVCEDDGSLCTVEMCSNELATCHIPVDADGDGVPAARVRLAFGGTFTACGGQDCDDSRRDTRPGARELCNGMDEDCDGVIDNGCPALPETCGSAQALAVRDGVASVSGFLAGARSDLHLRCATDSTWSDLVYYADLDPELDYLIEASGDSELAVSAAEQCDMLGTTYGCDTGGIEGASSVRGRIWLHRLPVMNGLETAVSRRIHIAVAAIGGLDAFAGSSFSLTVRALGETSDVCSRVGLPNLYVGQGVVLGWTTQFTSLSGTFSNLCTEASSTASGLLAVRSLTRRGIDVFAESFTPILSLSSPTCAMDDEIACVRGSSSTPRMAQLPAPPFTGTAYIRIAGSRAVAEPYIARIR